MSQDSMIPKRKAEAEPEVKAEEQKSEQPPNTMKMQRYTNGDRNEADVPVEEVEAFEAAGWELC